MERGPRACNRILARKCYTAAKVAAGKSTRPDAQGFLETVQKRLEILGVPGLLSSMFPFGGGSGFDMDPSNDSSQRARTKQMLELIRTECEALGLDTEKMIERIKSKFDIPEVDER